MSMIDKFDPNLEDHLAELTELMECNLDDKKKHVERLMKVYPEHSLEIEGAFSTWEDLKTLDTPVPGAQMDANFYKMLNSVDNSNETTKEVRKGKIRWLNPRILAVAATFLLGLSIGNWLNLDQRSDQIENAIVSDKTNEISFASIELTPAASDRIREINDFKSQESVDLKILDALNKVILNDPNVNVRLTAIETMVLFSDIPEARKYLIEAIPFQESSIVQLELADIMIGLEEKESSDEWQQLLESDQLETDVRFRLKENLKTIL